MDLTPMLDARLEALASYDILDTPPEPEFDDIVQIARHVCETATALVSLVGVDRQWFKARAGFDACETPLDRSVCVHALVEPDLLVIPDLTLDARTRGNALVTDAPHIRFYAGAPLRTPDGIAIGSLCVIDGEPRPAGLTSGQAETLKALARQVMAILRLRRATADRDAALVSAHTAGVVSLGRAEVSEAASARLHADQLRQTTAQEAGGVGIFELNVATHQVRVSAETCRIFGVPVRPAYPAAELQALVVEADRPLLATPQAAADGSVRRNVEYRVRRAGDAAVRWVSRTTDVRTDAAGQVVALVGVVRDVTERKLFDVRAQALIDLGDALRDVVTTQKAVDIAARSLGETLSASRAALSLLDLAAGTFKIESDWCATGTTSIVGTYPLAGFAATIKRLKDDVPIVNANIPADRWLAGDAAGYAEIGVKAQIVVPLIERGRLVAAFFVHSAQPRTWSRAEIDFAVAVADRVHATLAKLRAEAHQHVLNQELSHRLKNTLSMVQAITTQTLRGIAERDVVRALEERIIALSKAHDVLLQQNFASASIAEVTSKVMGLHDRQAQVSFNGPDVTLGPKATLSLTMLLHEMATNAVKYGGLSVEAGRVAIDWHLETDPEPLLVLLWTERGGPPAQAPKRRGFGSRLIGMGLVGSGKAKLDYAAAGLMGEFRAPLSAIEEN